MELAHFVNDTEYHDLPSEVVRAVKRDVLDTIAVGLGGSSANGVAQVLEYAEEMGGRASSTILAYGTRVPPTVAALVNGTMCHALDYDDTHDRAVIHSGCIVVPAALATAEHIGHISGKELINAIALGVDIHCRLGLATRLGIGWMLPALYGYFGAATAVGKLLGLDQNDLLNAWGVAYVQAAGNLEMVVDGGLTKRLQAGLAASGGVMSGLLAKKGVTGSKKSFEGRAGIFNLYQRGEYEPSALTDGLGQRFEVTNLSFKPYACCRASHSSIDTAVEIAGKHAFRPEQIEAVKVGVSAYASSVVCEPIEAKRQPRSTVDAQFSLPYCVACALCGRKVDIDCFTTESIKDPAILAVASRVQPYIAPDIDRQVGRSVTAARMELRTAAGDTYKAEVKLAKGHPQNPMSDSELEAKFRACSHSSGGKMSPGAVDSLLDAINRLEELEDITQLTRHFACLAR